MSLPTSQAAYTRGSGTATVNNIHFDVRDPTPMDVNYQVGQEWINEVTNNVWFLTSISSMGGVLAANWVNIANTGAINTINHLAPVAGDIEIAGTANQIATGNAGNTVTLSLTGPYTPATYTAHGVLVGEGSSSIAALAVGPTNSVLQGHTGADPAFTVNPTVTSLNTTGNLFVGGDAGVFANLTIQNNLILQTTGGKVFVAPGVNASIGTATLVGGTVTVNTSAITGSSLVFVTCNTVIGAQGILSVPTGSYGIASFVINSSNAGDNSVVNWWIIN